MDTGRGADQVDRLREVTAAAAEIFTEPPRRRAAISYLRQRGIDASGLPSKWMIGYAPPGWTRLVDRLSRSFDEETLLSAGVVRRCSRGTLIDTFRDRVIFGIRHPDGTVVGFIGRDLSGHLGAPKYLNTQKHALFDKGSLLFGLHEGTCATHPRQPVIVEGPLDALAIAARQDADGRADLLPVAPSGTAFTSTHARRVAEAAAGGESRVVVAMDGDAAGRGAALDAGERLRQVGLDVRIAMLPNGTDPAEHLAGPGNRPDVFRAENGLPLINLHVEKAIAEQGDRMQWVEGRLSALHTLTPYLATYAPDFAARQVAWIAQALDLGTSTVTRELAHAFLARPGVGDRHAAAVSL